MTADYGVNETASKTGRAFNVLKMFESKSIKFLLSLE